MTDDATGAVLDTYVAALQHDLVDVDDATLVGVVRRPTGWFNATVDENVPAVAPPESLLDDAKHHQAELEARGLASEDAHDEAWATVDFADRYREHLATDGDAQRAVDDLEARVRDGESIALVCFENTETKRCHRTTLREVLEARVDGAN